jgi:Spy/CpxP family protein refolding chaperone
MQSRTIRLLVLVASLGLPTALAHAQHGGGPGGGGPGGGPGGPGGIGGGTMGAPRNSFMGDRGPMPYNTTQPIRSGPQLGLPGRWWDDGKTVNHLSLRNDQQKKMDDIFNTNKGTLLDMYTNVQREETRLSSMSPKELQDEAKVFAQIDRVAMARADLEKEKVHILLQIRQQLDPDQLNKLDTEIANLR